MDKTTNKVFTKGSVAFLEACANAHVTPTKRQASKFRNKKGRAYNEGRPIKKVGDVLAKK